jgi:hypothetical protein
MTFLQVYLVVAPLVLLLLGLLGAGVAAYLWLADANRARHRAP